MKILWKESVSTSFWVIGPKLCGNCAFAQNFHSRKLGEITVFLALLQGSNIQNKSQLKEFDYIQSSFGIFLVQMLDWILKLLFST